MRQFNTGGTRSEDTDKIDYSHSSAISERVWCEYMHEHRKQENGKLRSPDNYKKGLPFATYLKSFRGHMKDFELLMEGVTVIENGKIVTIFDALMGIRFNLQGLIIETVRGLVIDRKYTNGKLKKMFNYLFNKKSLT